LQQDWRPNASQAARRLRAQLYKTIRDFFDQRDVLEVDTPILSSGASTDPMLDHLSCINTGQSYYLQTSPEFAMKRLLAAESGSIYQICRCFRAGESGRRHNPEFTMLEWYRTDFSLQQLIDEIVCLLQHWFPQRVARDYDYEELITQHTGLNYDSSSIEDIRNYLSSNSASYSIELLQGRRDDLFDLIFSSEIEPTLGIDNIAIMTNYPASQAQFAELSNCGNHAKRFEVYINGIELANGYEELADSNEQAMRFAQHNEQRIALSKPAISVDQRLLSALTHGLPQCSGVALGLDRLLMLVADLESLDQVLEFSLDRA